MYTVYTQMIRTVDSSEPDPPVVIYGQWLASTLNLTTQLALYTITKTTISKQTNGPGWLARYHGSRDELMRAMFPLHHWNGWEFKLAQNGFWLSRKNQLDFMAWIYTKLDMTSLDGFYQLTKPVITQHNGAGLLSTFGLSTIALVRDTYPNHIFHDWKFKSVPQGYWKNSTNRRHYMDWLGAHLNYKLPEDWYRISKTDFQENYGGGGFLDFHNNTPQRAVAEFFPELLPWKFTQITANYWKDETNCIQYVEWLFKTIGCSSLYNLTCKHFQDNGGGWMLKTKYKGSSVTCIMKCFPEKELYPWCFVQVPLNFWKDKKNKIKYLDWLFAELGFTHMDDWYSISIKTFNDHNGGGLMDIEKSYMKMLMDAYPTHNWYEWKFSRVPVSFWKETKNIIRYCDWLFSVLNFNRMDDWYQCSINDFCNHDGGGAIYAYKTYRNCLFAAYPKHTWCVWKFTNVTVGFWEDKNNRIRYLDWLFIELGFTHMDDWYGCIGSHFTDNHGGGLMTKTGTSPYRCISETYDTIVWDKSKFNNGKYSSVQIEWLDLISISTPDIVHAKHKGEFRIPKSRYSADGYSKSTNTIYEFDGDFWHGNPAIYDSAKMHPCAKKTFGRLYASTLTKRDFIVNSGYTHRFIWETDWIRFKSTIKLLQRRYRHSKRFPKKI